MRLALLILLFATPVLADVPADGERDGEIHRHDDSFLAWDAVGGRWLEPRDFWLAFAARERGKNWGESDRLPPFAEVGEHDALLVKTADGECLMYFFHRRWRRANDVWRWHPAFNDYSGCATVFDRLP
ncbi:MAG: hypothetical protein AAF660_12935 [Pseudomonadota bacterium]